MTTPFDAIRTQLATITAGLDPKPCSKCQGRGFYYVMDRTGEDYEKVHCEHVTHGFVPHPDDEADAKHEARKEWLNRRGFTEKDVHFDGEVEFVVDDYGTRGDLPAVLQYNHLY